ncbi:hypothetical protein F5Y11DRAFT_361728 [Daldinia sp. FL1419]|nr:hypothetical protein F5Y11DRAFT_361728 [Daldinia sp. FL1419]
MRRFDDRFARQNRCEPPPEFPLASPYPRIVHHLSGPNRLSPPFTFITREGLTPKHSHKCSTPWSVFQDGSLTTITPASLQKRDPRSPEGYCARGYNTPERATFPKPLSP